jgi:hypothetical protein
MKFLTVLTLFADDKVLGSVSTLGSSLWNVGRWFYGGGSLEKVESASSGSTTPREREVKCSGEGAAGLAWCDINLWVNLDREPELAAEDKGRLDLFEFSVGRLQETEIYKLITKLNSLVTKDPIPYRILKDHELDVLETMIAKLGNIDKASYQQRKLLFHLRCAYAHHALRFIEGEVQRLENLRSIEGENQRLE